MTAMASNRSQRRWGRRPRFSFGGLLTTAETERWILWVRQWLMWPYANFLDKLNSPVIPCSVSNKIVCYYWKELSLLLSGEDWAGSDASDWPVHREGGCWQAKFGSWSRLHAHRLQRSQRCHQSSPVSIVIATDHSHAGARRRWPVDDRPRTRPAATPRGFVVPASDVAVSTAGTCQRPAADGRGERAGGRARGPRHRPTPPSGTPRRVGRRLRQRACRADAVAGTAGDGVGRRASPRRRRAPGHRLVRHQQRTSWSTWAEDHAASNGHSVAADRHKADRTYWPAHRYCYHRGADNHAVFNAISHFHSSESYCNHVITAASYV